MKMTENGVMIHNDRNIEPIIPMGLLCGEMGYQMMIKEGKFQLFHPERGEVEVETKNGCPQVSKRTALKMIEESEKKGKKIGKMEVQTGGEKKWLADFVMAHPVLRELPEHLRTALVETPSRNTSWSSLVAIVEGEDCFEKGLWSISMRERRMAIL